MGLRIQNNVEAFNAHRQLDATSSLASKSMEKLSSGYRINRAADDAAGLAISEKMRGQIGGLAQAQRNAQDGISLVQTAEGALTEVHSMLQRVRDLKVQFDNGTLADGDKTAIAGEVLEITKEVASIVDRHEVQRHVAVRQGLHVPGRRQHGRDDLVATATCHRHSARRTGGLQELTALSTGTAAAVSAALSAGALSTCGDRQGDRERLPRPRQLRRGAEPPRAPSGQPGHLPGEPDGVRVAHPRRGHGG